MKPDGGKPAHSIQTVARRTGLTPDVIRAWERRYQAVEPTRTSTQRRLYTDEDVRRLLLLRRATLAGRRISEVAHLPLAQLSVLVEEDEAAAARAPVGPAGARAVSAEGRLGEALSAVKRLDAEGLDSALRRAARELGLNQLLDEVVVPLMDSVGESWRQGTLRVYHEHMATTAVRSLLDALRSAQGQPVGGPSIVVGTPSGEAHELGALVAALISAADGWRVTYLGADTPAEELVAAATRVRAHAIALSVVFPADESALLDELCRLRERLPDGLPVLLGGLGAGALRGSLGHAGFEILRDHNELSEVLGRMRRSV